MTDNNVKLASSTAGREQSETPGVMQRLQRVQSAVQPAKADLYEV